MNQQGPQNATLGAPNISAFTVMDNKSYTNNSRVFGSMSPSSGTAKGSTGSNNQTASFDLHNFGTDILESIYHVSSVSSLSASGVTGNTGDFLHLIRCFGYGQFASIKLNLGGQSIQHECAEVMYAKHDMLCGMGGFSREMLGNYETEAQLIIAAQNTQVFIAPVNFNWIIDQTQALKMCTLGSVEIRLEISYAPLTQACVLRGNDSNTSIGTYMNGRVNDGYIVGTSYFISKSERDWYDMNTWDNYFYTSVNGQEGVSTTISTTTTTASSYTLDIPHLHRGLVFFARQSHATDGTSYTPNGVGMKDRFDFGTHDGSEPVQAPNFFASNNKTDWPNIAPAMFFRTAEMARHCRHKNGLSQPIYCYGFTEDIFAYPAKTTTNMSRMENPTFKCNLARNTYEAGQTQFFIFGENIVYGQTANTSIVLPFLS